MLGCLLFACVFYFVALVWLTVAWLWFGCFLYCGMLLLVIGLFAGLVVLSLLIVWTFTFRGCFLLLWGGGVL